MELWGWMVSQRKTGGGGGGGGSGTGTGTGTGRGWGSLPRRETESRFL